MGAMTKRYSRWLAIGFMISVALLILACLASGYRGKNRIAPTPIQDLAGLDGPKSAAWDGRPVVVEGYWHGPFEGFSISTKTGSTAVGEFLLMKPSPQFRDQGGVMSKIVPARFRGAPVFVSHNDYVRVSGIYHARGYRPSGYFLESAEWIEFREVHVWDRRRLRWEKVDGL